MSHRAMTVAMGCALCAPDHVVLPHARARQHGLEDERIQDLLRQEDAARRSSSCLN